MTYRIVAWITMARSTVRSGPDAPRHGLEDDVEERRPAAPAPDAGPRPEEAAGSAPREVPPPDTEHRPIGALLVVGFLTLTILVTWYGMFALNLVRN
jgi:hypothetical protein